MQGWRQARVLWALTTIGMLPASAFLWLVGGMSACGEETYSTPPGSFGDSMCGALVDPVAPWALIASAPLLVVSVVGFIAIHRESRRLFAVAMVLPLLLVGGGLFAATALF
jgi:hypothetical protein